MAANPIPVPDLLPATPPPVRWRPAHRVLFRFVLCYLLLYCLPDGDRVDILSSLPRGLLLAQTGEWMWHAICPWVAIHVFGLSGQPTTYFPTGSGDTTLAYIQNLLILVFSLGATLVWSILDRRRANYCRLHAWLRLLVRYTLALTLFQYGFAKVVPQQFQPTRLMKFIEPYGEFSPMGVLWNFMGASMAYTVFSGAAEVLGGVLLFFRRTTTLGALVSMGVMANVVALNFCYDVPVKLYSTNLLLMAVFLAAPDLRRLVRVLVLNRAAVPADPMAIRFERRPFRIASLVLWIAFVGYTLGGQVVGAVAAYQRLYAHPLRPSIYGVYDVETFTQLGKELVLATDSARWRKVAFQPGAMVVRTMDDRPVFYPGKYDEARSAFTANNGGNPVTWSRPDADHLAIECNIGGVPVSARLRKVDMSKFLLESRGFHWISEFPFNR
jgi:uncharacterized membrane protein YphA (DoxX/SURF4 family)